jgi:NTE family protein
VVALDYDTGRRTVFAGPGEEPGAERARTRTSAAASLAEAVMASCAIPGWYAPVTIARHRYVDGGAWSSTNVDLLVGDGLDEVVVIAPMVTFAPDRPRSFAQIVDRQWRAAVTSRCLGEVAAVHATGTAVTVLGPGAEDLAVMGTNVMAPSRRAEVLRTSLRTSREALLDPETILAGPQPAEAGSPR